MSVVLLTTKCYLTITANVRGFAQAGH